MQAADAAQEPAVAPQAPAPAAAAAGMCWRHWPWPMCLLIIQIWCVNRAFTYSVWRFRT
jgi:hypothetical protein